MVVLVFMVSIGYAGVFIANTVAERIRVSDAVGLTTTRNVDPATA